ncbi:MAG: hypothetical protein JSR21_03670 [Proteobacteria bacterium]|nr:hypothetical protein [Pseudomonadota bacterium]
MIGARVSTPSAARPEAIRRMHGAISAGHAASRRLARTWDTAHAPATQQGRTMNNEPGRPASETPDADAASDEDADRFAAKLQRDVQSWAGHDRNAAAERQEDAAQELTARQVRASMDAAAKAEKDAVKARAKAKADAAKVEAAKPTARKPGPFSMSYDGLDAAKPGSTRRSGAR